VTAEIINLRKVRKQREREAKTDLAEQNRVTFGRSKSEREQTERLSTLETSRLDGHQRPDPEQALGAREDDQGEKDI